MNHYFNNHDVDGLPNRDNYRYRGEYPLFDLYFFEHRVLYAGPSLHYATERWWATLTWNYQIAGKGGDEPVGQTFAEEQRNLWRLKVGFNF